MPNIDHSMYCFSTPHMCPLTCCSSKISVFEKFTSTGKRVLEFVGFQTMVILDPYAGMTFDAVGVFGLAF